MIIAPLPVEEELRLADLASYDILDTGTENDFDELVELAADICNCPISLITFLDEDRQWFKAKLGTEEISTSRDIAFCSHAILQDDVMMIEDTAKDLRFFDNPLVTGEENIRFYAGAPILSPTGYKLGTICVIDHAPKKLSQKEEKALTILSNQVARLLELRKKNALIRQRAAEVIALKSSAIETIIKKQEREKSSIAFNLHEDIAQRLSSVMLYLKMAGADETKRMEYLDMADSQTSELLAIVRNLSYNIAPHAVKWIPAEDIIAEFIEKTADTFPFTIQFKVVESEIKKPAENALAAIRIIELWLKFLADKKGVSRVVITVQSADDLEISIENNGPSIGFEEQEKHVFESSIYQRVTATEGSIDISVSPNGNNLFKAILSNTESAVLC